MEYHLQRLQGGQALNLKSGSQHSEKCRWFQLVDEFMFDRANVVSHAHVNVKMRWCEVHGNIGNKHQELRVGRVHPNLSV